MATRCSAAAKVLGETSGPTAGAVPKADGAPGVLAGVWAGVPWAAAVWSAAMPMRVREAAARKSRLDRVICPLEWIVAATGSFSLQRRTLNVCIIKENVEA